MTLKSIVNDAQDQIGIPRSNVIIGATDATTRSLLRLLTMECRGLARRAPWQRLTKVATFTSTATEEQSGAIPSDFDRYLPETMFNRTRKRWVSGPLTAMEYEAQKAIITSVLTDSFRIFGNSLYVVPTPAAGDTYAFEYVSTQWCENSGGTAQSDWAADLDVPRLDAELLTLGLVWRFKKARKLDYGEDFRTYEMEVAKRLNSDGGKRTIRMGMDTGDAIQAPRYPYIPDGSWTIT